MSAPTDHECVRCGVGPRRQPSDRPGCGHGVGIEEDEVRGRRRRRAEVAGGARSTAPVLLPDEGRRQREVTRRW